MRIAFDNNILAWMLSDATSPPIDQSTGEAITEGKGRLIRLQKSIISGEIEPIIVPTPVLAEVFSAEPQALHKFLPLLNDPLAFSIAQFGLAAAIELSIINNEYFSSSDKRGGIDAPWQKIKTDRQIYAIAKLAGADAMYTDDRGLTTLCEARGMRVVHSWEIPPPENQELFDDNPF